MELQQEPRDDRHHLKLVPRAADIGEHRRAQVIVSSEELVTDLHYAQSISGVAVIGNELLCHAAAIIASPLAPNRTGRTA